MQSASLQRHARALPLPARASDTTLRLLVRLVACPPRRARGSGAETTDPQRLLLQLFACFCDALTHSLCRIFIVLS